MRKKSKNLLLLVVILAIIGIAVGYAALSQNLTLNGTATLKSDDWNVHFVSGSAKVTQNSTTYGDATISLDSDNLKGTFSTTIAPGESVIYEVQVTNEGSIPAKAETPTITGTTTNISCSVSEAPTSTIANNSTHTYTVTVTCKALDSLPETAEEASITVTFPYTQSTTSTN